MPVGAEALSFRYEERLGCPPLIRLTGKIAMDVGWPTGPFEEPDRWRAKLRAWHGNVGVVCGHGLVVVDVDLYKGPHVQAAIDDLHDRGLPRHTPTAITGQGGQHLYYRLPQDCYVQSRELCAGIDIKGDGGYVVAPPSVHPDTGQRYEWEWSWSP